MIAMISGIITNCLCIDPVMKPSGSLDLSRVCPLSVAQAHVQAYMPCLSPPRDMKGCCPGALDPHNQHLRPTTILSSYWLCSPKAPPTLGGILGYSSDSFGLVLQEIKECWLCKGVSEP